MSLEKQLHSRSQSQCELCKSTENLGVLTFARNWISMNIEDSNCTPIKNSFNVRAIQI